MAWWIWIVSGLALLGAEILTPGSFFSFFLGISALVVGLFAGLGVLDEVWIQALVFAGVAIVSMVGLRGPLIRLLGASRSKTSQTTDIEGEAAVLLQDLDVGALAKAELRGTTWNARNAGSVTLKAGQRCKVQRVEGLTLFLISE